jgi:hypothetical protein
LRELIAEFEEYFSCVRIVFDFTWGGEALDGGFQGGHGMDDC